MLQTAEIVTRQSAIRALLDQADTVIVGKRHVTQLLFATLLAGGHALLEDVPGVGKTTLVKVLAALSGLKFGRIQFTPDLLPSDITGVEVFDQNTQSFSFRPGPVFANLILADEINRASPKTQAALLEVMEERQVTVDLESHRLPEPFMVLATQNPIEQEGTFPLPEAQMDRFMVKLTVGYLGKEQEVALLNRAINGQLTTALKPAMAPEEVIELQQQVGRITIESSLLQYIVNLVEATRQHPDVALGASPRGAINLARLSQAYALTEGRSYVLPDDIKRLAVPVLAHRVIIQPLQRFKGQTAEKVVNEILSRVVVPV